MTLKEIEAIIAAIKAELEKDDADVDALNKEFDELTEQRNAIIAKEESRSALLSKIASGEIGQAAPISQVGGMTVQEAVTETASENGITESRAADFAKTNRLTITAAESRALLLSGGNIATPTKVSGISDKIGDVPSSIIDMVTVEDCTGMSADNCAYETDGLSASANTEGSAAASSDMGFGIVTIRPDTHSLISYVSDEIQRQSPLNYATKVQSSAYKALRKKAAAVVTAAITGSSIAKEITNITAIGADTLRKIVFGYGSDETVEGSAVLFLNKNDLIAFGDVRGEKEKKAVYEITPDGANPNVGTIKDGGLSVRYCINSNCTPLTGTAATAAKQPTMFYGNPACAKLDLFGEYEVKTSEDYKFAEGLLAVRGKASFGAGMIVKDGFNIVTIPATT